MNLIRHIETSQCIGPPTWDLIISRGATETRLGDLGNTIES